MRDGSDLSERQKSLLQYIVESTELNGRPPTNREIGNGLQIRSTGHVDYHLKVLESKGYIARTERTSRGIRVLVPLLAQGNVMNRLVGLPIAGSIAAGQPIDVLEGHAEHLDCVNSAFYDPRAFALRVRGVSMIDDGIFDGDYIIVEPTSVAHNNDIIVATNVAANGTGAATVKRFIKEGSRVRLQPANEAVEPIIISSDEWDRDWQIQGRVAGVVRIY
jgi:repressor LexA